MIVETEAYRGWEDKASHAYGNRRTARTETMYAEGGVAYIYLCYGVHSLFNVVCNVKDVPHAVLVRAIQPIVGVEQMLRRRQKRRLDRSLAGGPGSLSKALGIHYRDTGSSLQGRKIWIAENGFKIRPKDIAKSRRVGVAYAGRHANLNWRFRIRGNPWCSTAK